MSICSGRVLAEALGGRGRRPRRLAERQVRPLLAEIVPTALVEMLNDPNKERSQRVAKAMLQMKKIDIKALTEKYEKG